MEKNKINRSILELNDKFNILNSEIHNLKLVLSKVNNTTQPIKKYNTNEFKEEQFKPEQFKPEQFKPEQFKPEQFKPEQFKPEQFKEEQFKEEEFRRRRI